MLPTTSDIEVKQIPINKIKIIHRMRRTYDNNVEDLKRSIKEIGLLHSIAVAKKDDGYLLLSGLHRLTAMRELGEEYISATIREDNELINKLVILEENLVAKRLNAIEEAEAIILREQILIKLGRKAVVGSNQYTQEDLITNTELAKQLGYTRRTYSYKKAVANINQEAKDIISETNFCNNMMDMYRLQKLPDHLQVEIANTLASGKAKSFKRAWVLSHLKFADNKWDSDIQTTKDKLGVPKSVQRWDRKKNKLNDICYYVSHNEDAIVKKSDGQFGTNQLNNYAMLPEQSRWFVNYFSNVGDLVCDPYAGKGTNIIAAAYEGRRVIGYDLNFKNTQLIKETCLNNTNIDSEDLTIHNSCGVDMVEYKEASNMIDLFLLDPPYYKVVNDKWDNQWFTLEEYINWCDSWLKEVERVAKWSNSLWLFGFPHQLMHIFPLLQKYGFAFRQQIVVNKGMQAVAGRTSNKLKMFPTATESIFYFYKDANLLLYFLNSRFSLCIISSIFILSLLISS